MQFPEKLKFKRDELPNGFWEKLCKKFDQNPDAISAITIDGLKEYTVSVSEVEKSSISPTSLERISKEIKEASNEDNKKKSFEDYFSKDIEKRLNKIAKHTFEAFNEVADMENYTADNPLGTAIKIHEAEITSPVIRLKYDFEFLPAALSEEGYQTLLIHATNLDTKASRTFSISEDKLATPTGNFDVDYVIEFIANKLKKIAVKMVKEMNNIEPVKNEIIGKSEEERIDSACERIVREFVMVYGKYNEYELGQIHTDKLTDNDCFLRYVYVNNKDSDKHTLQIRLRNYATADAYLLSDKLHDKIAMNAIDVIKETKDILEKIDEFFKLIKAGEAGQYKIQENFGKDKKEDLREDFIAKANKAADEDLDEEKEEEQEPIPEVEPFELTERELEHTRVLSAIAKKCYSGNKRGFKVVDKLDAIAEELKDSPYTEMRKNHFSLWYKKEGLKNANKNEPIYIITSHADNVSNITTPFSELKDNNHYLKGTYDNMGTNAASVILMKEEDLPGNVVFAFTANEESGSCSGIKMVIKTFAEVNGFTNLKGIALDVTYEGFDEGLLYSIENMNGEMVNDSFITGLTIEPEGKQTFSVTPIDRKSIPEGLGSDYFSGSTGMMDEAFIFEDKKIPGLSFCLPVTGEMHSNSGTECKQPTFEGYVLSLASFVYELTKTHPEKIEEYRTIRGDLVEKNEKLVEHEEAVKKQRRASYSNYYTRNDFFSYGYGSEDFSPIEVNYGDNQMTFDDLFGSAPELSNKKMQELDDVLESVGENMSCWPHYYKDADGNYDFEIISEECLSYLGKKSLSMAEKAYIAERLEDWVQAENEMEAEMAAFEEDVDL